MPDRPAGRRGTRTTSEARLRALHTHRWRVLLALMGALNLAACELVRPYVPPSEGHIVARPQASAPTEDAVIPPPARVSSYVPPPQPVVKPQTYSVVVNEVPVKELLNALARDTRHGGGAGRR